MIIDGKTKIIGLFGYPVEHTLSPIMHNSASEDLGINYCYLPFLVKPGNLKEAVNAVRVLNFAGVNVTIPYKEEVLKYLDVIDKEAELIGAVNTIVNKDGQLYGYNTDGRGFIKSLEEDDVTIQDKKAIIIGSGGAAKAIAFLLLLNQASEIAVFDIDTKKADALCQSLKTYRSYCTINFDNPSSVNKYDIIINATPLGLNSNDPMPINPELITSLKVVYDVIYKRTKLLLEAKKRGAKVINGAGMLLWQAVLAYELWTGVKPPVELMRKALYSKMEL